MDIELAKQEVVKAGIRLLESGLIARTWGNVSCRVDEESFVITPSGRAYDSLTPDDIVLVKIADCSYDSEIKPSSEKGVHAAAYKLRPDVNFVIHTHQQNASAISFLGFDINGLDGEAKEIIGDCIPIAKYGLSGTPMLRNNVEAVLAANNSNAAIMKHHGAVCLGKDYDEAFKVAECLEKVCGDYILNRLELASGEVSDRIESVAEYVASVSEKAKHEAAIIDAYSSERVGDTIEMHANDDENDYCFIDAKSGNVIAGTTEKYPESAELHKAVYNARKDINCIIHSKDEEIVAYSRKGSKVKPLIDDFAQIVGLSMKNVEYDPSDSMKSAKKVVRKLKGRNAVMLKDNGALCASGSRYDAQAVEMVVKKEIRANAAADLIGGAKYINPISAALERIVYTKKYSKQNKTNK